MRPLLTAVKLVPLAAALLFAGCGGGGSKPQSPASAGAPAPGGGLSVGEALESELDGPLMVRGYLIERDGTLRLCEATLESSPPQCGEPSLRVAGPAPGPSERRVSLLGDVHDGTITVSETAGG